MPAAEHPLMTTPPWGTSSRTCGPVDDVSCDVLIVGAGIVGLTTALAATRAGASVVVVDAARIGAGTSASTPGVASILHGVSCQVIEETHGSDAVMRYVAELERALDFIGHEAAAGGVPTRTLPSHAVVEDAHQAHQLQRERFAMRAAGVDPRTDDKPGLPFATRPSIRVDGALALQPRQYAEALGRAVVAGGGLIHEGSRLARLVPGAPIQAHFTGRDEAGVEHVAVVRAGSVLLATGVPEPDFGLVGPRLLPTTVHALAGHGYDLDAAYRLIDDPERPYVLRPGFRPGQVVVAGRAHVAGRGDRPAAEELGAWVASHLPDLEITHRWQYDCYRSYDGLPLVGEVGLRSNGIHVATGFGDDHMAAATAGALQIADHMVGSGTRLPWSPVHPRGSVAGQARGLARIGAARVRSRFRRD
ncbi:NAD(P)/FAD-dependent oxidoreductase [Raineyella fluvialis]|uniref:FAD-dependent oxidoreductase n=1 Tax=Raineyella fluvialis TaxID=2662261 RepID=A0A5Q2FAZ8_9ACTN|nr:FAD-binding oxidoreductase [Raineyella fluvialis]QGF24042.1 FAD-dependent oxidoreductase [Raineyella fluvialis]